MTPLRSGIPVSRITAWIDASLEFLAVALLCLIPKEARPFLGGAGALFKLIVGEPPNGDPPNDEPPSRDADKRPPPPPVVIPAMPPYCEGGGACFGDEPSVATVSCPLPGLPRLGVVSSVPTGDDVAHSPFLPAFLAAGRTDFFLPRAILDDFLPVVILIAEGFFAVGLGFAPLFEDTICFDVNLAAGFCAVPLLADGPDSFLPFAVASPVTKPACKYHKTRKMRIVVARHFTAATLIRTFHLVRLIAFARAHTSTGVSGETVAFRGLV